MSKRPLGLAVIILILWIAVVEQVGLAKSAALPDSLEGSRISIQGEVYKQEDQSVYLKNISIENQSYSFHVIISTTEPNLKIGNIITAAGICRIPEHPGNPGQFNSYEYYLTQNVRMRIPQATVTVQDQRSRRWRQMLADIRTVVRARFTAISGETDGAVFGAVLLGDKSSLDEETKQLYNSGGLSHLLTISGLHISMIGMAIYRLFRRLAGGFLIPGAVSSLVMIQYLILTGMGTSARRALLMFLVYLVAQLLGRGYDLISSAALAFLVLLTDQPRHLFQAGFQLSFLCIAGIGLIHPVLVNILPGKGRLKDALSLGIAIQLATLPCLLYWFGEYALFSILVNLAAVPLASLLVLAGGIAALVSFASAAAGSWIILPGRLVLRFYEFLCTAAAAGTGSAGIWGAPDHWQIGLYYVVLVCTLIAVHKLKKGQGRLLLAGTILVCLAVIRLRLHQPFEMTFLDVGQGDGIYWRGPAGQNYLCDGGSSTVGKLARYRLEPFLKHQGVRRLDAVFITHMDEDHLSGIREMLEGPGGIVIGTLFLPDIDSDDEAYLEIVRLAEEAGVPIRYLKRGDRLTEQDLTIRCLWPRQGTQVNKDNRNEQSMVLHLDFDETEILLTGDIEGGAESDSISGMNSEKIHILKAAHHGSNSSGSELFLEQVRPAVTILSYGRGNRYGHPHPEAVARLEAAGSRNFYTAVDGAVTVISDGKKISIERYKN